MAEDGRQEIGTRLLQSSFRGARFYVRSVSVAGGRKATERPIINSDDQVVDDVGLLQRSYNVAGYVTALYEGRTSNESGISIPYTEQREKILEALEIRTPAAFVHPIEGRIENLVAKSWTLDEAVSELGIGLLTITFVKETTRPVPVAQEGHEEAVAAAADAAEDSLLGKLAERWGVDPSFVESYNDALGKLRESYSKINAVADSTETSIDAATTATVAPLGQFAQTMANLTSTASAAASFGTSVSLGVKTAFAALNNIFPTAAAQFTAMRNAFDFGDTDIEFDFTSPSGRQRKQNFDAMNSAVKGLALSNAYRAATDMEYVTIDEIETTERIIEAQFQVLATGDAIDEESLQGLTDLRESFNAFLRDAKLTARKVVTEEITAMTPRTLAFVLYEDEADEFTAFISGLNSKESYELIGGVVKVLTS